jgi:hypothetical protein
MFVTPLTLIDRTIERLRSELKPEGKLCKEALLTISVLLPKLKAVRCTPVAMTADYRSACPNCDDT